MVYKNVVNKDLTCLYLNIIAQSVTRILKSWYSVTKRYLALPAKAIKLRNSFPRSPTRVMVSSQVHMALLAARVAPQPVVLVVVRKEFRRD